MKKTFISIVMVLALILSLFATVSANEDITIYVNDEILQCDTAPFIKDGRTMVPMRKIFEALNANVEWEGTTQTITATKDNTQMVLQINNSTMYKNGVAETLDVAPVIVHGSTFVPVRAVSQSLNASVEWNESFATVYINASKAFQRDKEWLNVYMAVHPAGYTLYENIAKDALPKSFICVAGQVTGVFTDEHGGYLILENAQSLNKEKVKINLGVATNFSSEEIHTYFENEKIILIGQYLGLENAMATIMPTDEICVLITQDGVLQNVEYYYAERYPEETYAVCSPDGKRAYVVVSDLEYFAEQGWARPTLTMYAPDGQSITIYEEEIECYIDAGWSTEMQVTMYAPDGRTMFVSDFEIPAYQNVGWFLYPVTTMYALDGRTMVVADSEISAYQNVGWYLKPVTTMYAPDGRTTVVGKDEVYAYRNAGWYETYDEAQAANRPSYSDDDSDYTYVPEYNNQPNSGGSAVYRTPSGKRYHFDPNCGGKNSYQTTL